jgi:hypothetical protein
MKGIWIEFEHIGNHLLVVTVIGEQKQGEASHQQNRVFVTNEEIQEIITQKKYRNETILGEKGITHIPSKREIVWIYYHPFGGKGSSISFTPPASPFYSSFQKKGIAQIIEYKVLQYAIHYFPHVQYVSHHIGSPTTARILQLRKRRIIQIEKGRPYSIKEALEKLRQKIAVDVVTHRKGKNFRLAKAKLLRERRRVGLIPRRKSTHFNR